MRKRVHIRAVFISCLFSLLLLLTGCSLPGGATGQTAPTKAPPNKQILITPITNSADITTFDPALAYDSSSISAISMVFTGLVQTDAKAQVQPQLARSWSQSQDGLAWTFHLKPHLQFSDGTPLTATDVIYSLDRALQPTTKSTVAPIYLDLIQDADKLLGGRIPTLINDSLTAPDPNTVVILTQKKAPYFLAMLTHPCAFVVEKKLITTYGAAFTDHLGEGGGAGPFKVSQYTHGKEIDFVPNPRYYGPHPQLSKVVFPFYQQAAAAYSAYGSGQVDTTPVPLEVFNSVKKRTDFHQVPQLWINYYTMNYRVPPFDNIHVRQAFALAIDKAAIASNVWKNTVIPTNHIIPQGMPGYNPDLKGPDGATSVKGNATLAKSLFSKGLSEEHLTSVSQLPAIKLTYATGLSSFDQEVTAMTQMWQSVLGVTITPDPVDYNTLLDEVTAATNNPQGLQMWGLSWVGEYPDPQDWLTRQFANGVPNNNMNYGQNTSTTAARQQLTQTQLENADANGQAPARLRAYQQAEQQLVNDVAWLPMSQVTNVFLRKPYVRGFVDTETGQVPPDAWAGIYVLQH